MKDETIARQVLIRPLLLRWDLHFLGVSKQACNPIPHLIIWLCSPFYPYLYLCFSLSQITIILCRPFGRWFRGGTSPPTSSSAYSEELIPDSLISSSHLQGPQDSSFLSFVGHFSALLSNLWFSFVPCWNKCPMIGAWDHVSWVCL